MFLNIRNYVTHIIYDKLLCYRVKLSEGQRQKLAKAYASNSAITIRLNDNELEGSDKLMFTRTQINNLNKAKR